MTSDPLERFSALTREWFTGTFAAPTSAQAEAWSAIADGDNTLVIAPTGSGKTLAAFLWAIDNLASSEPRPATGDTPPARRRELITKPPDVLITTPESLFLMLTSAARESLAQVQTVIVDEVHAVAGTKRGVHLALSLERLDCLLCAPAQRIGLSATVRPLEEAARFLGGAQPVAVVAAPADKRFDLSIVVPVED